MRFCPDCGTPLETRAIEHRQRLFCPQCSRIQYRQLKVGAGALIEQRGCLLLLQRTTEPFKGCWNLPAGYAEADEDPSDTVVRETYEETGLQVEVSRLVNAYSFDDDPRGNGILIVYECQSIGGMLSESAEGTNPTLFAPSQIPANLAGGGHDHAILAWQAHNAQDWSGHRAASDAAVPQFANERHTSTKDSVERPKVGVAVIVIREDKVLLGRRKNAHGAGTWCFPGGHLEFGESIQDCARREVLEETGLHITNLRLATFTNDVFEAEGKHYVTLFVIADHDSGKARRREPEKSEGWEWFSWDDLPRPLFLPIQNLLRQGFHPFH